MTAAVADEELIARIRRMNAEHDKFVEEGYKLRAEELKLRNESLKLQNEAMKLGRDARFAPVVLALSALASLGALVTAVVTLMKVAH